MDNRFHSVPLPVEPHPAKGRPPAEVLARVFGHAAFRGIQAEAVGCVMAGRDVLATMPTGGGKSLAYQVPAMSMAGTALVVSPLVALMRDQCDALRKRGVRAAALVGGRSMARTERAVIEDAWSSGGLDLLYVSPERLASGMMPPPGPGVSLVAIDEAHCVCEWGHGFRPEYLAIPDGLTAFPRCPRVALTASASEAAREEIAWRLLAPDAIEMSGGFDRPNISLAVHVERRPVDAFVHLLRTRPAGEPAVAYCRSRVDAERVAGILRDAGIPAACYHAGMDDAARNGAQDAFAANAVRVVAATSAFGMGIDKPDIGLVAHLGLPASVEAYYQESGRSGRDGRPALAWLAWSPAEARVRRHRIMDDTDAVTRAREEARFEGVMAYVEAPRCRRASLLRRFGEAYPAPCGNCDLCISPPPAMGGEERVVAMLATVAAMTGEGAMGRVVGHLVGTDDARGGPPAWHGSLARDGAEGVRRLFRQCAGAGLVTLDDRLGTVRITPGGFSLLREGRGMAMPVPGSRAPTVAPPPGIPGWRGELWSGILDLLRDAGHPAPSTVANALAAAAGTETSLADAARATGLSGAAVSRIVGLARTVRPVTVRDGGDFDLFG